jgi:prolipoprotein diacylglyceryl transferase
MQPGIDHLVWNANPEIFRVGSFAPRWYGLLFPLGFIIGYLIMVQIYRRERRAEAHLSNLFLYVFVGTLAGARLGHVLFYQPDYYFARPWEIFMIWQGGLASHGGFFGVLIALYFFSRNYTDLSFLELADRLTIAVLPAASLIRVGNFFNSEIVGVPTTEAWAVIFVRVDIVPRHPAMLYESAAYFIVFFVLYFAYWKTGIARFPGRILGTALTLSFTARFIIEFVKEAQAPFEQAMLLNMGQLLSIPFIIAGLLLVYVAKAMTADAEPS